MPIKMIFLYAIHPLNPSSGLDHIRLRRHAANANSNGHGFEFRPLFLHLGSGAIGPAR
jgi:hypothetical protein